MAVSRYAVDYLRFGQLEHAETTADSVEKAVSNVRWKSVKTATWGFALVGVKEVS